VKYTVSCIKYALFVSAAASIWLYSSSTRSALAQQPPSSNISPTGSTACAIATREGGDGTAYIGCGGKSDSEIDGRVLSRCPGCSVVAHFTHACAAWSQEAGGNLTTGISAWAIVQLAPEGTESLIGKVSGDQANARCTANGGKSCYVRISQCDTGAYMAAPLSGRSAR
jgi:hypothetical protein